MSRRIGLAVALGLLLAPTVASAQRGFRGGPAMTADGPVYNPTMTPEWRQAGGNPEVYQQIMMQKMAMQEQAAFQKQVAEFQKWAKANPKAYQAMLDDQRRQERAANAAPLVRRKKKKPTLKPSTSATAKADAKAPKPEVTVKDVEEADDAPAPKAGDKPAAATSKPSAPK